jgi:hypothetical protein
MDSHLSLLLGQKIKSVSTELDSTIGLKNDSGDSDNSSMAAFTFVLFENYSLSIYNKHELVNLNEHIFEDIIGEKIISYRENESEVLLGLSNGDFIKVDLSDDAYNGPEAMSLIGPNNLFVVWNQ